MTPPDPDSLNHQGLALAAAHKLDEARRAYRRAIALAPSSLPALGNLGNLEGERQAGGYACRLYLRGLAINPGVAALHLMLGTQRLHLGQDELGTRSLARALELNPGYPKAHLNLGLRQLELRRAAKADEHFRQALRGDPVLVAALAARARALSELNQSRAARQNARRALALAPAAPEALAAAGQVAFTAGDHAEAKNGFTRAVAVNPGPGSLKALMFYLHYDPSARSGQIYAAHRRWAANCPSPATAPQTTDCTRDRRLRIGYLSGDLYDHPVGRNIVGLIENHDRSAVEIHLYSERTEADFVNARLRAAADKWRPISGLDDRAVARAIREDSIDILVVLAGHTPGNRVMVASQRAAPVQVSMYDFTTSGLDAMDWFLSDETLSPIGGEEQFSERVYHVPCLYLHMPVDEVPSVKRRDAIVFGSCSNPVKLNERVITAWTRILHSCPESTLVLKYRDAYSDADVVDKIRHRFAVRGIAPSRLFFNGHRTGRRAHLEVVGGFDVALDPFPFNGCTTTYEALWMGIPVVTLLGRRFVGRISASMLTQIGLDDLIAADDQAYIDTAVGLAADRDRRTVLRDQLRGRLKASRLLDAPAFARDIEAAYRAMWDDWCERRSTMAVQTSTSAAS